MTESGEQTNRPYHKLVLTYTLDGLLFKYGTVERDRSQECILVCVYSTNPYLCIYFIHSFLRLFYRFLLFNKNPISDTDINEVTIHMRKKAGCISLLLVVCA